MRLDYEILCYRVMYKQKETDDWNFEDFSQEEKAYEYFRLVKCAFIFSKMLKIQYCVD